MSNKRTVNQEQRAQRQKESLALRLAGASYPEIAAAQGIVTSTAYNDVQSAIRDIPRAEAEQLRTEESMKLDRLQRSYWEKALKGNLGAADMVLKIINRRIRLYGLDAPQQVEVSNGAVDLDKAINDIIAAQQVPLDDTPLMALEPTAEEESQPDD